jgi:uncharacterized metal-binding protein YceD (DUF177 family)
VKDFIIPYKGLRLGEHVFEWDLTKKFFEQNENPDILDCDLKLVLKLEKKARMLELFFLISGWLEVPCDRCLGPLKLSTNIKENYYIKFGTERKEESDEVMIIPESEYQFDISPLVFDFISLSIPMKRVHESDGLGDKGCDEEMIRKLENLNNEKQSDPRWDALKKIKLANDN